MGIFLSIKMKIFFYACRVSKLTKIIMIVLQKYLFIEYSFFFCVIFIVCGLVQREARICWQREEVGAARLCSLWHSWYALKQRKKPDMHIYPFNRNLLIISTHWHTKHNMIESVVKKTCYEELSAAGLNSLWHSWYAWEKQKQMRIFSFNHNCSSSEQALAYKTHDQSYTLFGTHIMICAYIFSTTLSMNKRADNFWHPCKHAGICPFHQEVQNTRPKVRVCWEQEGAGNKSPLNRGTTPFVSLSWERHYPLYPL